MQAIIDDARLVFTLINTFEVDPANSGILAASLRTFTKTVTRHLPGFVIAAITWPSRRRRFADSADVPERPWVRCHRSSNTFGHDISELLIAKWEAVSTG